MRPRWAMDGHIHTTTLYTLVRVAKLDVGPPVSESRNGEAWKESYCFEAVLV
jgi:hypothetical protein